MSRIAGMVVSAALVLLALCCGVHAVRIENPTVNGIALDWCRSYGTECGEPAASEFCRSNGYPGGATAYSQPLRLSSGRTRVITNGAICQTDYHVCDTFTWIECGPATQRFDAPMVSGQPLDYCMTFEQNCGQAVADAFCQGQGYKTGAAFGTRQLTAGTTLTMGDRAICDVSQHRCDAFTYILCSN